MYLVRNPAPRDEFDSAYNENLAADSFRKGRFGLAFDIWDTLTDRHLFRSYNREDAEPLAVWEARNHWTAAENIIWTRAEVIKADFQPYIPTLDAIKRRPVSMQAATDILRANYRIALRGEPENPAVKLTCNHLRQAMHFAQHSKGREWFTRYLFDEKERILIRAAIGHLPSAESFDMPKTMAQAG